jgi:hypothetical protein
MQHVHRFTVQSVDCSFERRNIQQQQKKKIRARIYNETAPDNVPERLDKKENVRDILKTDDSHTEMRLWELTRLLRKIEKKKREKYIWGSILYFFLVCWV